jgi:hypothetical protein
LKFKKEKNIASSEVSKNARESYWHHISPLQHLKLENSKIISLSTLRKDCLQTNISLICERERQMFTKIHHFKHIVRHDDRTLTKANKQKEKTRTKTHRTA